MDIPRPRIRIAPMTIETVEAVEALERECFPRPWSLASLTGELGNPMAVFRTAGVDGVIAGYVGMHHILDEGHLTNIAVSGRFRRQGIASALMAYLLDYAAEHDLRMVTLEARRSNAAAVALYEGLGFERTGCRAGYYDAPAEDALIMTRKL